MQVGSHWPGIITPKYEAPRYNEELVQKVLGVKQARFDQAFSNLQNLKKQALSISYLNEDGQKQIDGLNQEIEQHFAKISDFGDLSDNAVTQKHLEVFDKLANRQDLIELYRTDKTYRDQLQNIQTMKKSKDPYKAGYSPSNYYVWMNQEGGLQEYRKKSVSEASGMGAPEYTPYYNIMPEIASITKQLATLGVDLSRDDATGGYIVTSQQKGVSKERIRAILDNLSPQAKAQIHVDGQYEFMRSYEIDPEGSVNVVHKNYVDGASKTVAALRENISNLEADIAKKKSDKEDVTADEQLLAQYKEMLPEQEAKANTSLVEFQALSPREIREHYAEAYKNKKLDQLANGFANLSTRRAIKSDQAFWAARNLEAKYKDMAFDQEYKMKALELKAKLAEASAGKESAETESMFSPNGKPISENTLQYGDFDVQLKTLKESVRELNDMEIKSVVTKTPIFNNNEPKQISGIEKTFLDKWMIDNDKVLSNSTESQKIHLAKKALGEFRSGTLAGYDEISTSYSVNRKAQNVINEEKNKLWNQAKTQRGIPPEQNPDRNGNFLSKEGKSIPAQLLVEDIFLLAKNSDLYKREYSYPVKLDPKDYTSKNKEVLAREAQSKLVAGISEALENTGTESISIEDIEPTSVSATLDGKVTFTTKSGEEFKHGSQGKINTISGAKELKAGTTYTITAPSLANQPEEASRILFRHTGSITEQYKGFEIHVVKDGTGLRTQLFKDGSKIKDVPIETTNYVMAINLAKSLIDNNS